MTQTLANRMTTASDPVFVACSPLQPQEEMLAIDQMVEAHGGGIIIPLIVAGARVAAPHVIPVLTGAAATIIAYEWTSEASDNTDVNVDINVNVNVDCGCDD